MPPSASKSFSKARSSEREFRELLERGLDGVVRWEKRYRSFAPHASLQIPTDRARQVIDELVDRLADNYPFFHPDYAGQMLRPPHALTLAAYALAARINPNNHALDGGPATARLELECIDQIAAMFGWAPPYLGHLTTSGTMANLEALWVASKLQPGRAVLVSSEAHYTHARMCDVLGTPLVVAPVDYRGRADIEALDAATLERVGTVVVTAGTTAAGAVDRIDNLVEQARARGWRIHADAAYGGFFATLAAQEAAQLERDLWQALRFCDSIVVDPHKHGLQPYGCGAVLFSNPAVGKLYKHDSPYTYFTSRELHLGEISLECSRAGAAAAALWATLRCLPLTPAGLGRSLLASRRAALKGYEAALRTGRLTPVVKPQLDILTLAPLGADERTSASVVSSRSHHAFERCQRVAAPLFVATWRMPRQFGSLALPHIEWDEDHCTVVRSVLMKPEHEEIVESLVERIAAAV